MHKYTHYIEWSISDNLIPTLYYTQLQFQKDTIASNLKQI